MRGAEDEGSMLEKMENGWWGQGGARVSRDNESNKG
jgi:hypothetical protein